jgi:hypothetical protein
LAVPDRKAIAESSAELASHTDRLSEPLFLVGSKNDSIVSNDDSGRVSREEIVRVMPGDIGRKNKPLKLRISENDSPVLLFHEGYGRQAAHVSPQVVHLRIIGQRRLEFRQYRVAKPILNQSLDQAIHVLPTFREDFPKSLQDVDWDS